MELEPQTIEALGRIGGIIALSTAAIGSAIGSGTAGLAAIGAWKRSFLQDRPASFLLVIFVGAPLSQIIYSMILMNSIADLAENSATAGQWPLFLVGGLLAGIGMAASAIFQGKAGAAGADSLGETGKGFGLYLMTIGMVETVALFVLVFSLGVLPEA
ncbi:V-type ATP synthase subunit K [Kiritimatiellota bacterium B12222]|nr:V-type ATP synthase subunit K [Kiritimatiellota bacterium B12222]